MDASSVSKEKIMEMISDVNLDLHVRKHIMWYMISSQRADVDDVKQLVPHVLDLEFNRRHYSYGIEFQCVNGIKFYTYYRFSIETKIFNYLLELYSPASFSDTEFEIWLYNDFFSFNYETMVMVLLERDHICKGALDIIKNFIVQYELDVNCIRNILEICLDRIGSEDYFDLFYKCLHIPYCHNYRISDWQNIFEPFEIRGFQIKLEHLDKNFLHSIFPCAGLFEYMGNQIGHDILAKEFVHCLENNEFSFSGKYLFKILKYFATYDIDLKLAIDN
jgi:hypothetical protein